MGKKQQEPRRWGAGWVVFFWVFLIWLIVSHPWLLLFPIVYWFCFSRPAAVRRRPPPKAVSPPAAPPGFLPKDREYNRYLARTWDEQFEALVRKREQVPPS